MVGARLEDPKQGDYKYILITKTQNTVENGYGANSKNPFLLLLAKSYGQSYLPLFDEAQNDTSNRYIRLNDDIYLNTHIYKERMKRVIEPFLVYAHECSQKERKLGYIRAIGLGTGAWKPKDCYGCEITLAKLQYEIYEEILKDNNFPDIHTVEFVWLNGYDDTPDTTIQCGDQSINIKFSSDAPATAIKDSDKFLLIAQYPWDGGSYVGNEYWAGFSLFADSGDPAAACCSTIPSIQNPDINPDFKENMKKQFEALDINNTLPDFQASATYFKEQLKKTQSSLKTKEEEYEELNQQYLVLEGIKNFGEEQLAERDGYVQQLYKACEITYEAEPVEEIYLKIQRAIEKFRKNVTTESEKNAQLQEQLKTINNEKKTLQATLNKNATDSEQFRKKLEKIEQANIERIAMLTQQAAEWVKQIEDIKNDKKELEKKNNKIKQLFEELELQLEKIQTEKKVLELQAAEWVKQIKDIKNDKKELKKKNNDMYEELQKMSEKNKCLEGMLTLLTQEEHILAQEKERILAKQLLVGQKQQLELDNQKIIQQNEQAKAEKDKENSNLARELQLFAEQKQQLELDNQKAAQTLSDQLKDITQQYQQVKTEKEKIEGELTLLKAEREEVKKTNTREAKWENIYNELKKRWATAGAVVTLVSVALSLGFYIKSFSVPAYVTP